MAYCSPSDVRVLTGVTEAMMGDDEVESLIAFSDQQINDDVGSFPEPVPTRIRHLSALLTAIKVYTRPDLRGGFSVGNVTVSDQQVEEALMRWMGEVKRVYAYYGKTIEDSPQTLKSV